MGEDRKEKGEHGTLPHKQTCTTVGFWAKLGSFKVAKQENTTALPTPMVVFYYVNYFHLHGTQRHTSASQVP